MKRVGVGWTSCDNVVISDFENICNFYRRYID